MNHIKSCTKKGTQSTDALVAFTDLQKRIAIRTNDKDERNAAEYLKSKTGKQVVVAWIPGYQDIHGNTVADRTVKDAALHHRNHHQYFQRVMKTRTR